MGMYTKFKIDCYLSKDTPEKVIEELRYLAGYIEVEEFDINNRHDFFKCQRFNFIFLGGIGWDLYDYKAVQLIEELELEKEYMKNILTFDNDKQMYRLKAHSDFKDYYNEIELFLDYISDYVVPLHEDGYFAFEEYEERDAPVLFYKRDNSIIRFSIEDYLAEKYKLKYWGFGEYEGLFEIIYDYKEIKDIFTDSYRDYTNRIIEKIRKELVESNFKPFYNNEGDTNEII